MAKRNTRRKPVVKKKRAPLAEVFDCPLCNSTDGITINMRKTKVQSVAYLMCKEPHCKANYKKDITDNITVAIDVFLEWKDEVEKEMDKKQLVNSIEAGANGQVGDDDTPEDETHWNFGDITPAETTPEVQPPTGAIARRNEAPTDDTAPAALARDIPIPSIEKDQVAEGKSTLSKLTKASTAKITKAAKPKTSAWVKKWSNK